MRLSELAWLPTTFLHVDHQIRMLVLGVNILQAFHSWELEIFATMVVVTAWSATQHLDTFLLTELQDNALDQQLRFRNCKVGGIRPCLVHLHAVPALASCW